MTFNTIIRLCSAIAASLLMVGCAQNVSPNTYQSGEVGVASRVVPGVVIAKRSVNIDANSGAGGLAGVAAGAAAGSTMGSSTSSNVVGAVGGAVVGGVAGNAIDKAVNHHQGYEYIIRLNKGRIISVVQEKDVQFRVNQRVLIIYGAMTRLIPDTTAGKQREQS